MTDRIFHDLPEREIDRDWRSTLGGLAQVARATNWGMIAYERAIIGACVEAEECREHAHENIARIEELEAALESCQKQLKAKQLEVGRYKKKIERLEQQIADELHHPVEAVQEETE